MSLMKIISLYLFKKYYNFETLYPEYRPCKLSYSGDKYGFDITVHISKESFTALNMFAEHYNMTLKPCGEWHRMNRLDI